MSLSDLTDPNAVLAAIEEYDQLGQSEFLAKYGFGRAREYFLVRDGRQYDSKAIAGAAYGYQYPEHGPLAASDFSGGHDTVQARLESLGFSIDVAGSEPEISSAREGRIWALCAKPSVYDIPAAVKELDVDYWTTKGKDIRTGDRVVFWQTRDSQGRRGVIALGQVLGNPRLYDDSDSPYWLQPAGGTELRVPVEYSVVPDPPLFFSDVNAPILGNLSVARAHGGTVFHVQPEQWDQLIELLGAESFSDLDEMEAQDTIRRPVRRADGQGFGLTPDQRRAVELHAMELARAHFSTQWEFVEDVSASSSFDLLCRSGDDQLRVEVKGTTGDGLRIILTKNEVRTASDPDYALFVASDIELSTQEDDQVQAMGGYCRLYEPWQPDDDSLEPLVYTCQINPDAGQPVNISLPA